ncbi:hypothetical protein T484DRAFT_1752016 [Baffinella frigidus]|nr:hypothetical protein T484DRAFT_1752016 [Cryptophyta sp. CCMP2293]
MEDANLFGAAGEHFAAAALAALQEAPEPGGAAGQGSAAGSMARAAVALMRGCDAAASGRAAACALRLGRVAGGDVRETDFVEEAEQDSAVLDTALFALQREQGPLCAARVAEVVGGGGSAGRGALAALSWVLHGVDGAGLVDSMGVVEEGGEDSPVAEE